MPPTPLLPQSLHQQSVNDTPPFCFCQVQYANPTTFFTCATHETQPNNICTNLAKSITFQYQYFFVTVNNVVRTQDMCQFSHFTQAYDENFGLNN